MLFLTLLFYSLVGATLGSIFGMIILLCRRVLHGLKGPDSLIHFTMASSISSIFFFYALLYFVKIGLHFNSSIAIFKNMLLFFSGIAVFFSSFSFSDGWIKRGNYLPPIFLSFLLSGWSLPLHSERTKALYLPFSR
jgi:hypothetical protein